MKGGSVVNRGSVGYLVAGLAILAFGLLQMISSLMGYWQTMDDDRAVQEKAEELGLDDIPGVDLKHTANIFLVASIIGCIYSVAGGLLILVALLKGKGRREVPEPRKSP